MSTTGIVASGLGALGQSARLDQAANNLANVSTPGFRRDRLSFGERLAGASQPGHALYNAWVDRTGGAPFIDAVRFDRQAGGFEQTGRSLDVALRGGGFFAVRDLETGRTFHTRAGNFTLDAEGRLVTADGRHEVLARDGGGIAADPSGPDLRVGRDGGVFQGDREIGRLDVRDFEDYSLLRKFGDNLFVNLGSAESAPADLHAAQGMIETSSVNPVTEMVEMIKALRALETNLQMIKIQDGTLERAVNDLGRLPK